MVILPLNRFIHIPAHVGQYIGAGFFHHNYHEVTEAEPGNLHNHYGDQNGNQRFGVFRRYYLVNKLLEKYGIDNVHYRCNARENHPRNEEGSPSFHVVPNPQYLGHILPFK
jgi:hypothetical protein